MSFDLIIVSIYNLIYAYAFLFSCFSLFYLITITRWCILSRKYYLFSLQLWVEVGKLWIFSVFKERWICVDQLMSPYCFSVNREITNCPPTHLLHAESYDMWWRMCCSVELLTITGNQSSWSVTGWSYVCGIEEQCHVQISTSVQCSAMAAVPSAGGYNVRSWHSSSSVYILLPLNFS